MRLVALLAFGLLLGGSAVAHAEPFDGPRVAALAGLDRTDGAPSAGASDGFFYGLQAGYDVPLGPVVVGIEGDVGGSTASSTINGIEAEQGVFATAAVRLGVPVSDHVLPFVRGGYAYHEVTRSVGSNFSGSGFTVGGGVEWAFTDRLFARGEYRYSDYGDDLRGQQFLAGVGVRF